jgi:hypothetical protein
MAFLWDVKGLFYSFNAIVSEVIDSLSQVKKKPMYKQHKIGMHAWIKECPKMMMPYSLLC